VEVTLRKLGFVLCAAGVVAGLAMGYLLFVVPGHMRQAAESVRALGGGEKIVFALSGLATAYWPLGALFLLGGIASGIALVAKGDDR